MSNEDNPIKQLRSLGISFISIIFICCIVLWGVLWNIGGDVANLNRKVDRVLELSTSTDSKVQTMEAQMSDLRISTRSALNANQFHRRNQNIYAGRRNEEYEGDQR